jgi:hypothetical protein
VLHIWPFSFPLIWWYFSLLNGSQKCKSQGFWSWNSGLHSLARHVPYVLHANWMIAAYGERHRVWPVLGFNHRVEFTCIELLRNVMTAREWSARRMQHTQQLRNLKLLHVMVFCNAMECEPNILHVLGKETVQTFSRCHVSQYTNQMYESPVWRLGGLINTAWGIKTKLRGLSPRENYTDRATADCRRS